MSGFKVPACAGCGHGEGDHQSNRSRTNPQHGICLTNGCDCRQFQRPEYLLLMRGDRLAPEIQDGDHLTVRHQNHAQPGQLVAEAPVSADTHPRPNRRQRTLEEGRDWIVDPDTGCWEWQNFRGARGYARCTSGPAHREVWRQAGRLLADGEHLHHRCENPGCVNPDHMEPKPPSVHLAEHKRADSNLNWDDVRAIRGAARDGARHSDLMERYGLAAGSLHALIVNETWFDPDYVPGVDRACDECGTVFRSTKSNKRFCRQKCRELWNGRRTYRKSAGLDPDRWHDGREAA